MDVVRGDGHPDASRRWGVRPCLFSYLSYKEDMLKNGQLGDRFTAGYRGGI